MATIKPGAISAFDRATSVTFVSNNDHDLKGSQSEIPRTAVYMSRLPDDWNMGFIPHGGMLLSTIMRSAQDFYKESHKDPINVTINYLKPATRSTLCRIEITELKKGRQYSTAILTIRQPVPTTKKQSQPPTTPTLLPPHSTTWPQIAHVITTFGNMETEKGDNYIDIKGFDEDIFKPHLPTPEDLKDIEEPWPTADFPLRQYIIQRCVVEPFKAKEGMVLMGDESNSDKVWLKEGESGVSQVAGRGHVGDGEGVDRRWGRGESRNRMKGFQWMRFTDWRDQDLLSATFFADAFTPTPMRHEELFYKKMWNSYYPTMDLNIQFKARPKDSKWMGVLCRTRFMVNGRFESDCDLYDEQGNIVAICRQSNIVVPFSRNKKHESKI
ncbi:hypothetical protein HDU76_001112 [Blyttiomyces sp. JEL0837]|nr:hypothetical protein HDU76_001112 [Blyttiomyces sp. JEL0837]